MHLYIRNLSCVNVGSILFMVIDAFCSSQTLDILPLFQPLLCIIFHVIKGLPGKVTYCSEKLTYDYMLMFYGSAYSISSCVCNLRPIAE
uniref:Uncharacterized protein n=1 Tax=Arundo donax TaxID=35708 RepID=A0A0A9GTE4_ARUDO